MSLLCVFWGVLQSRQGVYTIWKVVGPARCAVLFQQRNINVVSLGTLGIEAGQGQKALYPALLGHRDHRRLLYPGDGAKTGQMGFSGTTGGLVRARTCLANHDLWIFEDRAL